MNTIANMDIRTLKPEYLLLPFQAVECYFPNTEMSQKDIAAREDARHVCLLFCGWYIPFSVDIPDEYAGV